MESSNPLINGLSSYGSLPEAISSRVSNLYSWATLQKETEIPMEAILPPLANNASLAWVIQGLHFIYIRQPLPSFTNGFFAALSKMFELIDQLSQERNFPSYDQQEMQKTLFYPSYPALPINKKCRYSAEIFCFAKRIATSLQNFEDEWTLFRNCPQILQPKAESLLNATDQLLRCIRKNDIAKLSTCFARFDESWKTFIDCLLQEKRCSEWIGPLALNNKAESLSYSSLTHQLMLNRDEQLAEIVNALSELKAGKSFIHHIRYHLESKQPLNSSQALLKKTLRNFAHETRGQINLSLLLKTQPDLLKELLLKLACLNISLWDTDKPALIPDIFINELEPIYEIKEQVTKIVEKDPTCTIKKLREAITHLYLPEFSCKTPALLHLIKQEQLEKTLENISNQIMKQDSEQTKRTFNWCVDHMDTITLAVDIRLWLTAEKTIELCSSLKK